MNCFLIDTEDASEAEMVSSAYRYDEPVEIKEQ